MTTRAHVIFSVAMAIVVLAALVLGVAVVGSPGSARLQRFDYQRLEDLQTIFREVQSLCQDPDIKDELTRPLPRTLDDLATLARSERINLNDPETGQPYTYALHDATTYELCATFSRGARLRHGGVLEPCSGQAMLHRRCPRPAMTKGHKRPQ